MIGAFRAGVMGSSDFSPLSLFAAGEQGVWYDPSDLSTMFQDSEGTIPVTAADQYVGKIIDKSGRGNHSIQETNTNRPQLKLVDGVYSLLFSSTSRLESSAVVDFSFTDKVTLCAGIKTIGAGTSIVGSIFSLGSDTSGTVPGRFYMASPRYPRVLNSIQVSSKGSTLYPIVSVYYDSYSFGTKAIISATCDISGSSVILNKNGVQVANSTATQGNVNYASEKIYLGSPFDYNGHLYGIIIRGSSTASTKLKATETWMNRKTMAY